MAFFRMDSWDGSLLVLVGDGGGHNLLQSSRMNMFGHSSQDLHQCHSRSPNAAQMNEKNQSQFSAEQHLRMNILLLD